MAVTEGEFTIFIELKKPLYLMWSGFFTVVDQRIEKSNLIHIDLTTLAEHLMVGEEQQ